MATSEASVGYYLWPTCWIGDPPEVGPDRVDFPAFSDVVFGSKLLFGSIEALREGVVIFNFADPNYVVPRAPDVDFDVLGAAVLRQVTLMNAHLVCLYASVRESQNFALQKMLLTPADRLVIAPSGGMTFGDRRQAELALSRFPSSYPRPPIFDWRILGRFPITLASFEASVERLQKLLAAGDRFPTLAELMLRSVKAAEDHNYSLSLTIAWVGVEAVLQRLWDDYLAGNRTRNGRTFINADRRSRLRDGRSFTASVIAECLSLVGALPSGLYTSQVKVRQARNDWLHSMEEVPRTEATAAIELFAGMFEHITGLDLNLPIIARLHS